MKVKRKTKTVLKSILCALLALLILGGVAVGIVALVNYSQENSKTINPAWAVGGLDANGEYRATKGSIYTLKTFNCLGLLVTIDFNAKVSYQVYFYDSDNTFISCTGILTSAFDEVPTIATKARIVVTPNDDDNISWTEKNGYAKQITINVSKNQSSPFTSNVLVAKNLNSSMNGLYYKGDLETKVSNEKTDFRTYEMNIDGATYFVVCSMLFGKEGVHSLTYYFVDKDGNFIGGDSEGRRFIQLNDVDGTKSVSMVEGAVRVIFTLDVDDVASTRVYLGSTAA